VAARPVQQLSAPPQARLVLAKADHRDMVRARKRERGDYSVQVGTFRKKTEARDQLAKISRKFGDRLDDGKSEVTDREHGRYHARFVGLTESEAKNACRALASHRQVCKVVTAG
jgi:D-alanyl-D-alanine carboxypeptidase (penicillin-binding protein 5/6)